jgi:hypothetical protein
VVSPQVIVKGDLLALCCPEVLFVKPSKIEQRLATEINGLLARPERDDAKLQKALYLMRNFYSCRAG